MIEKSARRNPLENITGYSPGFSCRVFSHVMLLDQSRAGENIIWIITSDIDECATGTHKCSNAATCNNTKGGYKEYTSYLFPSQTKFDLIRLYSYVQSVYFIAAYSLID